jgi:hypothetical protein
MTTTAARRALRTSGRIADAVTRNPGISVRDLAREVKDLEIEDLERLRDALDVLLADARPVPALDPAVWGEVPSPQRLAAAREVGERARETALAGALDGALTREQTAARLGVTPQAVSERMKAAKLTAIRRGREWRFPVWQFSDDDVLPGLAELIAAWPSTPLALSTWATKPAFDLDGRAPAQELSRPGGAKRVLDLAEAISAAAW